MKAIIYSEYGSPDVLEVKKIVKPSPRANEMLIKVRAVEVSKADCEMRSFKFPVKWMWLPLRIAMGFRKPRKQVLGIYFSGEVETVGQRVSMFKKGDQLFGSAGFRMGAYAEYLCLSENDLLVPKPTNLSFEEAACVPLGGLNALHFLRLAKISKGEKFLVNGAGGSIGTFAVQIAKALGAEVTAVDKAIKEKMLRSIGADHFVDYTKENVTEGSERYDVILNMVAQGSYSKIINILKPHGRYLMANPRFLDMLRAVWTSRFTDRTAHFAFAKETKQELLDLKDMIEQGELQAVVDRIYPMIDVAEAHNRVETEQRLGATVMTISSEAISKRL